MPELPEVETTVRGLAPLAVGQKIVDIWTDTPKRLHFFSKRSPKGKKIESVYRRGKNIIISLSDELDILIHQKIAGHLLVGQWRFINKEWQGAKAPLNERVNSFIHFVITLSNGKMIALSDPRKFAKIEIWEREELKVKLDREIGPDVMMINSREFSERISKRKSSIKKVLLNQAVVSGVGNIYSDEALWDARINPHREPSSLSKEEKEKLLRSIKKVMNRSLYLKGDSMSDYRLIDGSRGGYQDEHKVYGREGLECFRRDGVIKREKINNRSVRFCPSCQK